MSEKGPSVTPGVRRSIAQAVAHLEIGETEAWSELDVLSNRTSVVCIEVFEGEIRVSGSRFEGLVNVHCTLEYGEGGDAFTSTETFPGRFEGTLSSTGPEVRRLTVDTTSYYA